jgi:hypothetical protein
MSQIHKVCDGLAINFPWIPDHIMAYKFGLCFLCKEEKKHNSNFDNKGCPHCVKETKIMAWAKGKI